MKTFRVSILVTFFLLSSAGVSGQLLINEFMASNSASLLDTDFNEYSDWIEIYNAGTTAVNLKGYYLTDNLSKPDKWKITTDQIVEAKGYFIFWADGQNQGNHASFKLAIEGEEIGLYDANLNEIDAYIFPYQTSDVSMGRKPATTDWLFYAAPTPNALNAVTGFVDFTKHKPVFSVLGGLFNQSISLTLATDQGGTIRYTLDGSEPELSDPLFSAPLAIATTTVVRARVFETNNLPGPILTHSYFINEQLDTRPLPVISIVSAPENFWDAQIGIYAQSFKPEWEVPINIELFENNGSDRAGFNEPAGAKINGLNSWVLPQKMLGIYFRGKYGTGMLDYPLFFDRERNAFDSFSLRASGSDWSYTLFRDILGQSLTQVNMDLTIQGSRPCMVYINGDYMGIHNIRSKVDADYIGKNYQLESGSFDMVENENYAESGTLIEYQNLKSLLSKDLSFQANYDAVAAVMDIENFTDYIITELYVRNTSIGHNVMAWKPHGYGKWQWLLMDLDRGFFRPNSNLIDFFESQSVVPLKSLMQNAGYKDYFGKRLANHLMTTFHPSRVKALIDAHAESIESEIPRHVDRWVGTSSSYGNALPSVDYWYQQVDALREFAEERPAYLLKDLQNYGFEAPVTFHLTNASPKAGTFLINDFQSSTNNFTGIYPKNLALNLEAKANPGFQFIGWRALESQSLLPKGAIWNYLDDGSDQGTAWTEQGFDESAWKSGAAQLGYGDGDEVTTVGFGANSSGRYLTTYFRNSFSLTQEQLNGINYTLSILYDDGAVVYLNGVEVARPNMPSGTLNYLTPAASTIGDIAESAFTSFSIDASLLQVGSNLIAVAIHQVNGTSSDISFDLALDVLLPGSASFISTSSALTQTLTTDSGVEAVFEATNECILAGELLQNTTLSLDCSPYYVTSDVTIGSAAVLTIEPGVNLLFSENTSLFIHGQLEANGTASQPITMKGIESTAWGSMNFLNTPQTSHLTYVILENATQGKNTAMFPAAISAFHADLDLNHLTILEVNSNPIAARYSKIVLTNSQLHSEVTGDLINVKYGEAQIRNCTFYGNDRPDTDAIDLDDVAGGQVINCRIFDLLGSNSDGIDIGEKATDILIDSLLVYHITDKGLSVGQRSTVRVTNSLFLQCNLGVGLKDSCRVSIDHSTFYGNNYAVSCFEKNLGDAGGNAIVTNSILSNSGEASYMSDAKSTFYSVNTLTDNTVLPVANLYGDPAFINPTNYDFRLSAGSPGIQSGSNLGFSVNALDFFSDFEGSPPVTIAEIFVNGADVNLPEYIMLVNPAATPQDVSGYMLTKGVTGTLPSGTFLGAKDTLYFTSNSASSFWESARKPVFQWLEGKLSNNGEAIELRNSYGILMDHLVYDLFDWPVLLTNDNSIWQLKSLNLDNHFGNNWNVVPMTAEVPLSLSKRPQAITIYPTLAKTQVTLTNTSTRTSTVTIYTLKGLQMSQFELPNGSSITMTLSGWPNGLYLFNTNDGIQRVIKLE